MNICGISHVACKFYSHSCARILTMSDFQDMTITFTFFKILFLLRIYRKICIFYKKYCNSRTIISAFSFRSLYKSYTKIQKSLLITILNTKLRKSLHYRLSLPFFITFKGGGRFKKYTGSRRTYVYTKMGVMG